MKPLKSTWRGHSQEVQWICQWPKWESVMSLPLQEYLCGSLILLVLAVFQDQVVRSDGGKAAMSVPEVMAFNHFASLISKCCQLLVRFAAKLKCQSLCCSLVSSLSRPKQRSQNNINLLKPRLFFTTQEPMVAPAMDFPEFSRRFTWWSTNGFSVWTKAFSLTSFLTLNRKPLLCHFDVLPQCTSCAHWSVDRLCLDSNTRKHTKGRWSGMVRLCYQTWSQSCHWEVLRLMLTKADEETGNEKTVVEVSSTGI